MLELDYNNDRQLCLDGMPNKVSDTNKLLRELWELDGVMGWPNVCPEGILPVCMRPPTQGRTVQEAGFNASDVFEAEPKPDAQPTQAMNQGGKSRWKGRRA